MKMKIKVLVVLALALLMINMAPVMRAEAAEDMQANFDALYESQAYVYAQQYLEANLGNNEYYCIFVRDQFTGSYDSLVSDLKYDIVVVIGNSSSLQVTESLNGKGEVVNVYLPSCAYEYVNQTAEPLVASTRFNFQTSSLASQEHVFYLDGNMDIASVLSKYSKITVHDKPVIEPLVLPVTEPGYDYWLYHKTTSGEYMYWSKDPFDLEVSDGKYLLNLSTGDIVYRLHMNPSHIYYRQILSGSMQYVVSPGDIFRSSHDIVFDGIAIDAWMEGDVTSEVVEEQYSIPHITKFLKRVRSARTPLKEVIEGGVIKDPEYIYGPREYSLSIDIELSGDFDAAVTDQKVLIDGNYIMASEEYFLLCEAENIEPDTTHFMNFVKAGNRQYYFYVDWSHIASIENLPGLTSDYGFKLVYSNAIDALIERGEFDVLYSKSVQAAYDDDIRRLCCPYRLACTLIGVVDDEYYYGDTYITVLYSELDKAQEDVFGVYSDYVSLDNVQRTDAIESTINSAQDDSLRDYIDKKDAELDALIEEYEMKLATLDATITSSGSGDLFHTFSNIANGISSLSGSFRSISTAVGNVFAFFPNEITSLLYAGFVALIVIAVYKALRG